MRNWQRSVATDPARLRSRNDVFTLDWDVFDSHGRVSSRHVPKDRPDINLRINAVTLVFDVALGITLIYIIGPIGVVPTTVLSELLRYGSAAYAVSQKVDGSRFVPRMLANQVIVGVLMFAAVSVLSAFLSIRSWLDLAVLVGTGVIVYGLVLLVSSDDLRFRVKVIWADARL